MSIFEEVGGLGLGSRLKRLSDRCLADVELLYKESGIDFEPRWFPVFMLLLEKKSLTITQATEILGISQPHVSLYVKEMTKAGLVQFKANPDDGRSKVLSVSRKGLSTAKQLQPIWDYIDKAIQRVLKESEPRFLEAIENVEKALLDKSLYQRVEEARFHSAKRRPS